MNKLITILAVLIFFSCGVKKRVDPPIARIEAEQAAAKIKQTQDNCYCMTSCIQDCSTNDPYFAIARKFIPSGCSSVVTVTWTLCGTNPHQSDPTCDTDINTQTTLTLCFYDCTTVTAHFHGRPKCLPCMPNDFCLQLTPQEQGTHTDALIGSYMGDPTTQVNITVAISTDPDITISCTTNPYTPNAVTYQCRGKF